MPTNELFQIVFDIVDTSYKKAEQAFLNLGTLAERIEQKIIKTGQSSKKAFSQSDEAAEKSARYWQKLDAEVIKLQKHLNQLERNIWRVRKAGSQGGITADFLEKRIGTAQEDIWNIKNFRDLRKVRRDVSELGKDFDQAATKAKNFNKNTSFINSRFGKFSIIMSGLAATLFVWQELRQAIRAVVRIGTELETTFADVSDKLGLTTDAVKRLRYEASEAGKTGLIKTPDYAKLVSSFIEYGYSADKAILTVNRSIEHQAEILEGTVNKELKEFVGLWREFINLGFDQTKEQLNSILSTINKIFKKSLEVEPSARYKEWFKSRFRTDFPEGAPKGPLGFEDVIGTDAAIDKFLSQTEEVKINFENASKFAFQLGNNIYYISERIEDTEELSKQLPRNLEAAAKILRKFPEILEKRKLSEIGGVLYNLQGILDKNELERVEKSLRLDLYSKVAGVSTNLYKKYYQDVQKDQAKHEKHMLNLEIAQYDKELALLQKQLKDKHAILLKDIQGGSYASVYEAEKDLRDKIIKTREATIKDIEKIRKIDLNTAEKAYKKQEAVFKKAGIAIPEELYKSRARNIEIIEERHQNRLLRIKNSAADLERQLEKQTTIDIIKENMAREAAEKRRANTRRQFLNQYAKLTESAELYRKLSEDVLQNEIKKFKEAGVADAMIAEYEKVKQAQINLKTYLMTDNPFDGLRAVILQVELETETMAEKTAKNIKRITSETESLLSDHLFDTMQGEFENLWDWFDSLGNRFKQMIDRMIADALAAKLAEKLFGDLVTAGAGSGGPGGGGWFGAAINWVLGGFGGSGTGLAMSGGLPPRTAKGAVFNGARRFQYGGIVNGKTYFPYVGGMGIMGEAGPEAVLPLERGPSGKLGVRAENSGNVFNINISAPSGNISRQSMNQLQTALIQSMNKSAQRNL